MCLQSSGVTFDCGRDGPVFSLLFFFVLPAAVSRVWEYKFRALKAWPTLSQESWRRGTQRPRKKYILLHGFARSSKVEGLWPWTSGDWPGAPAAKGGAGRGKVASLPPGPVHGDHTASAQRGPEAHILAPLPQCVHLRELLPKGETVTLHTDSKVQGISTPREHTQVQAARRLRGRPAGVFPP